MPIILPPAGANGYGCNAAIGYRSIVESATLTVSSGEPENARDEFLTDEWKTDGDTTHTFVIDAGEAVQVDYIAIAKYSFPVDVVLEYSENGTDYSELITIPAGAGNVFFEQFPFAIAQYYRLISTSETPFVMSARDIRVGEAYQISVQQVGYSPIALSRRTESLTNKTATGLVSGSAYIDQGVDLTFEHYLIEFSEAFSEWQAFYNYVVNQRLFYFSQDVEGLTERAVCQIEGKVQSGKTDTRKTVSHRIDAVGFI